MPRKPTSELTPEQADARRQYMRRAKARSRQGKPSEADKRTAEDRRDYWREQKRKKREENKLKLNSKKTCNHIADTV